METLTLPNILIDTEWLQQHIDHPQLVILDASSHMPGVPRDPFAEWQDTSIPGSRFFDFNHTVCDTHSSLPHMLPSPEVFTDEVQALGINTDSCIIIYDSLGIFSAPRAWWMFTIMGHKQCAVLNGGLPEWIAKQGATTSNQPENNKANTTARGNFIATLNQGMVKNHHQILEAINQDTIAIVDARGAARFNGEAKEPREGLISGHIPNSYNLPFTQLLNNKSDEGNGHTEYKPLAELKTLLGPVLQNKEALYATCGSGVTACVITFAAQLCGFKDIAVYDGSWSEWGQPELELPINTRIEP